MIVIVVRGRGRPRVEPAPTADDEYQAALARWFAWNAAVEAAAAKGGLATRDAEWRAKWGVEE